MTSANHETALRAHLSQLCKSDRLPGSSGYFEAKRYIQDCLRSYGYQPQSHIFTCQSGKSADNIFVESPADGDRVLIGAHYDSLAKSGQGADDNASAIAVLLELARSLSKDSPFTFVFFDREERHRWTALEGSGKFAKFYKKKLSKVLIMDLVGGSLAPGFENFYFQFGSALPALQHPPLEFAHFPVKLLEPTFIPRSDYFAFRRRGVAYCFLSSGTPWYYHTPHDTLERLDFTKMARLLDCLLGLSDTWHSSRSTQANWSQWSGFIKKIRQIPGLEDSPLFKKIENVKEPSRFQIVRLYSVLLPYLRQKGLELWELPLLKKPAS